MVYIVGGTLNLHTSDKVQGDLVRYLHTLRSKYRLTRTGDVTGMDEYAVNKKKVREGKMKKAHKDKRKRKTNKNRNSGNKGRENPRATNTGCSPLWNQDFMESLTPNPDLLNTPVQPNQSEQVQLSDRNIDLGALSSSDRQAVIDDWQVKTQIESDSEAPSGFMFALQECYFNPRNSKLGVIEKAGHPLHYDRAAKRPRAAIIASKNINLWLEADFTSGDYVTCKYITGVEDLPVIYFVSLYSDGKVMENIKYVHVQTSEKCPICQTMLYLLM